MSHEPSQRPESPQDSLREVRLGKLARLRELGLDPYLIERFPSTDTAVNLVGEGFEESREVTFAGRVVSYRLMGKAGFAHLSDGDGRIQAYFRRDDLSPEHWEAYGLLDIGDHVGIEGYLFTTKTGERSIHVRRLTPLSKALHTLPIGKEKDGETFSGLSDPELRLRHRHLDLIANKDARETLINRARIVSAVRRYFDGQGYLEVETPMLQLEAGGAAARPFKTFYNAYDLDVKLRISLELYLKRLICGDIPKVYEVGRVFRNEGVSNRHSPEFTMLEFYEAYVDLETMMERVEGCFRFVKSQLQQHLPETRLGPGEFASSNPPPLQPREIQSADGSIRLRPLSGSGEAISGSRTQVSVGENVVPINNGFRLRSGKVDRIEIEGGQFFLVIHEDAEVLDSFGNPHELSAGIVEVLRRTSDSSMADSLRKMIWSKFDEPWERVQLLEAIEEHGKIPEEALRSLDSAKAFLGSNPRINPANGKRINPEEENNLGGLIEKLLEVFVEPTLQNPTFVVGYPIETSPLAKKDPNRPGFTRRFEGYVLGREVCNAFSEINDPIDQRERFEQQLGERAKGDDEAHPMDEEFLFALESGMPPTGGCGIGLDRMAMLLTGASTIREVLMFPMMKPSAAHAAEDAGEMVED